ncbi:SDR family NAD(P)-dependent oxidoreductase [Labrenzia sp. R4_2]|uniref:SDR family NAD(P)-dependent oxidoreductase n=1 Tax=Labrenzia sp. R4_2 TaxID=2821107 RepID=UPI001ADAEA74|nr:SDR family NAD(P)-dependent oxidoreductase [Labrenzia sp. R4_2]MBO9419864.1 SDR family NAD(P)-dependent oxidoreductase [Labrenzia sp. R4_2]
MGTLDGKTMVITGAGRSTGRALAAALADRGADVHLSARDKAQAEDTCRFIKDVTGSSATAYNCNIADPGSIQQFISDLRARTHKIDILINSAAMWLSGYFEATDDDHLIAAVNSTVTGTILLTKHCLPLLEMSEEPDILTIVSKSGLTLDGQSEPNAAYHATKSAQTAFMNRLSQTHPHIRVMSVFPSDFKSDLEYKSPAWFERPSPGTGKTMNARHVVEAILFALEQDRICSVESLVLGNSASG